ncbi:hypothetical protein [Actinoplanes palleronii]|uniref:hypothetical protein n=1 Tax=Actinoplanes palleronii TaxID=113570 RepID=UPI0031DDAC5C
MTPNEGSWSCCGPTGDGADPGSRRGLPLDGAWCERLTAISDLCGSTRFEADSAEVDQRLRISIRASMPPTNVARVLLILDYSAPWANGNRKPSYFPTGDDAWSDIVDAAVVHFGPKVQAYEVWNEPNITHFGNYGDNSVATRADRYWELTRIAYQRVKARCPQRTVLAGLCCTATRMPR